MTALYQRRKIFLNGIDISGMLIGASSAHDPWHPYSEITLELIGEIRTADDSVFITTPPPLQQSPTEADVLSEGEPV